MSIRWIGVLAWVALMSLVWVIFTPAALSWAGLAAAGVLTWFALLTALTVAPGLSQPRSVAQIIAETEAEPALAVASASRQPPLWPGPRPGNRMKGIRPL
jgi:hypothetical protein